MIESILLQYLQSTLVNGNMTLKQMLPALAKNLQDSRIQAGTECTYWEEVQWRDTIMINPLKEDASFESEQLDSGDVIIIQEHLTEVDFLLLQTFSSSVLKNI